MINLVNNIRVFVKTVLSLLRRINWEGLFLACLFLFTPFLAFYNLELNPRPWHDEGSYLTLAKTFAEEGVYAVRNSDGYITFGAVQSLGPTVILPIAWVYREFGPGLLQGRIISGIYLLFTLTAFYLSSRFMFGRRSALVVIPLLLASPAVGFLMYGRPVFGEIPALGFFIAGWLVWAIGIRKRWWWSFIFSGLLLGGAIITKSQYLIIGFATISMLALLDIVYYRLGEYKGLIVMGIAAAVCVIVWQGWQFLYYGDQVFNNNLFKLSALAGTTMGFSLRSSFDALRFLFGAGSGYMYVYWGFPSLVYVGLLSLKRSRESLSIAYLVLFASIWLFYFVFLVTPSGRQIIPVAAVLAIFVSKLFIDLLTGLNISSWNIWLEIKELARGNHNLASKGITKVGTLLTLTILLLWTGYQLQKTVRENVLDKSGSVKADIYTPLQFSEPIDVASFLNSHIPKDQVIETWETELGILTDHQYHFPDYGLLAQAYEMIDHNMSGSQSYSILGEDYFNSVKPNYIVVGWYSRYNHMYDVDYLRQHAVLIKTIGDEVWGYEVYEFNKP